MNRWLKEILRFAAVAGLVTYFTVASFESKDEVVWVLEKGGARGFVWLVPTVRRRRNLFVDKMFRRG